MNKNVQKDITKITTAQGDDYSTGCLLDYAYFKENYRLIAIDLDADTKAIHQLSFNISNLWNILGIQQGSLLSKKSKKLC